VGAGETRAGKKKGKTGKARPNLGAKPVAPPPPPGLNVPRA